MEKQQEQPTGPEPRYAYFTVPTAIPGFVCVRLEREKGSKHCSASFSFCSPQDAMQYRDKSERSNRYSFQAYKPLARKIADARARTKRVKATLEFEHDGPMGEAFRRALELAKTTQRPYQKLERRIGRAHPPVPTFAPHWFKEAKTVEFGLVQPEGPKPNRMDGGDPPA